MDFEIRPDRTALIVFDMINDFLSEGSPLESPRAREDLVPRLKPLLAACREEGMKVVYTGMSHRPDGSDLGLLAEIFPALAEGKALVAGTPGVQTYADLAPQPGDIVIEKLRFDAFHGTELDLVLRQLGVDTLIIVGTSASIGIETTARAAVVRDYKVVVPSNGTVNKDLPDMGFGPVTQDEMLRVVLTMLSQFCQVCPLEELISRLEGAARA